MTTTAKISYHSGARAPTVTVRERDVEFNVFTREDWHPQKRRGTVTACRFKVLYNGRWRRLYSDRATHFINVTGQRLPVSGVSP